MEGEGCGSGGGGLGRQESRADLDRLIQVTNKAILSQKRFRPFNFTHKIFFYDFDGANEWKFVEI